MDFTRDRASHEFVTAAPIYYDDGQLLRPGSGPQSPRLAYITYWFFYAYNDAPPVPFLWNHEGDWENMSLLFEQSPDPTHWVLKQVAYAAHGVPKAQTASCASVILATNPLQCPVPRALSHGTQRIVGFVANGDHATYSSAGSHPLHGINDATSPPGTGFSWPTWKNLLPLESQGWAGFCGAWGRVGASIPGSRALWAEDRTGPLGPGCLDDHESQRKTGRPKNWGTSKSSPADRRATPGTAIGIEASPGPTSPSL